MKVIGLLVVGIFLLLAGLASADLVVLGTVYEDGFGNGLSGGASVEVSCAGNSLSKTSGSDGTYAILFSGCVDGSDLTMSVSKSGRKTFSGVRVLNYSELLNSGTLYSLVTDVVLTKKDASAPIVYVGGGGGGGNVGSVCKVEFLDCDDIWSDCVDGVQSRNCTSNCGSVTPEERTCEVEEGFSQIELSDEEPMIVEEEGFFSGITGAVVGRLGNGGALVSVIFVILIIGSFVFVKFKKKE